MASFHLQIATADGLVFDGEADRLVVRTTEGDVGILRGHIDYLAALQDVSVLRLTCGGGNPGCSGFRRFCLGEPGAHPGQRHYPGMVRSDR